MLELKARGKKGIWQIHGTLCGERIRESTGTNSLTHAQVELAKLTQEILDRHHWGEQKTATFAEAVVLYLEGGGEDRFINPLLDRFGAMRLADITSLMVAKFAGERYPKSGPQGINRQVYTPLIAVFRAGATAQPPLCPLPMFKRPKQPDKKSVRYAKDPHIAKLLPKGTQRLKAAVLMLTFSAARASEVCRIVDEDVDWEDGSIVLHDTKTKKPRRVKLPASVLAALVPLRGTVGPLFGFKTRHSLNQAIKRASKRAGVPYLSSHKVGRHAFAARLLAKGETGAVVMEAGGWSSARNFHETYSHIERSHVDKIVAGADTTLTQITTPRENVVEFQPPADKKATMSR